MRAAEFESKSSKPITPTTPDQARINALKQQKDRVADQLNAERERQKITRAQAAISAAMTPKS